MTKKIIAFIALFITCTPMIHSFFEPEFFEYGWLKTEFGEYDVSEIVVKKSVQTVWDNQEKIAKKIEESFAFAEEMLVPELKTFYIAFLEKREDALKEILANGNVYFIHAYLTPASFYLREASFIDVEYHAGNKLMHAMHVELLQVGGELIRIEPCNFMLCRINEFAKVAIGYNRIGHVDKAILVTNLCWAVLDAIVAIKMRLVKGNAQKCIVKQFVRILFEYDLLPKINSKTSDLECMQKIYQVVTERLQAIPTRSLVLTGINPYPNEDYLMSKLLEEINLWCTAIMQQMKASSVAVEKTKKRWWFW